MNIQHAAVQTSQSKIFAGDETSDYRAGSIINQTIHEENHHGSRSHHQRHNRLHCFGLHIGGHRFLIQSNGIVKQGQCRNRQRGDRRRNVCNVAILALRMDAPVASFDQTHL